MTDALERPVDSLRLAEGIRLEDSWFACKALDPGTLAIGEPAYHQCNWSYLITDGQEGLLWDTGSGRRPIAPLVGREARGQVTAFPSHMHFDHLGGIAAFGSVMLADLPMLRTLESNGTVTPPDHMFLGSYENLTAPTIKVAHWVASGEVITIGRRQLQVLHTPGHSPDSVSLWESDRNRLYAADFIYRGELYAQTPGASLRAYRETLRVLLATLPDTVQIVCAHGREENGLNDMPELGSGDLRDLARAVDHLLRRPAQDGDYQVNERMDLIYSKASYVE